LHIQNQQYRLTTAPLRRFCADNLLREETF